MKRMNAMLGWLVCIALCFTVMFCSAGCSTATTGQAPPSAVSVAKTAATVRAAAEFGVRYAIRREPGARVYFAAANAALVVLLSRDEFDPELVSGALVGLPVKELRDEDTVEAIRTALELYRIHFSEGVSGVVDRNAFMRPVLVGLSQGIVKGMK